MDREVLLLRLAQAEQSVAESKAYVARQLRLIVLSERDGHNTGETLRLLDKLLLLQQLREQERAKIIEEISDASLCGGHQS
jgi:hypothetical protein